MRRFILFCVIFLASSCIVQKYNEAYYNIDFRPYADSGFIISPLPMYASEYKPIATICIEFTPGADKSYVNEDLIKPSKYVFDDVYHKQDSRRLRQRQPSAAEMLDKFVTYAKSLGATGILDYRFEAIRSIKSNVISHYRLSGFAVDINNDLSRDRNGTK